MLKVIGMKLFISFAFVVIATSALAQDTRIDRAINAVKELCLVGTQFDLKADAAGNLTLFKLIPAGRGSASVNVKQSPGAAAIFDDKVRQVADEDIRRCIQPHITRIINVILGGSEKDSRKVFAPSSQKAAPATSHSSAITGQSPASVDIQGNSGPVVQGANVQGDLNINMADSNVERELELIRQSSQKRERLLEYRYQVAGATTVTQHDILSAAGDAEKTRTVLLALEKNVKENEKLYDRYSIYLDVDIRAKIDAKKQQLNKAEAALNASLGNPNPNIQELVRAWVIQGIEFIGLVRDTTNEQVSRLPANSSIPR